ncbi:MAG: tRNA methyltransferase [Armatimonadetes bacterium]|nr:tRNA methyltransferase [Armatimonadota bacterium]
MEPVRTKGKTLKGKTEVRRLHRSFRQDRPPKVEIAFFLQDWDDAYNVGGLYRVADAVGAKLVVTSGHTPVPPDPMIGVTSLGHHRRIATRSYRGHEEAVLSLIAEGWTPVAVEIADGAQCYTDFEYPDRVCFVLGNEVNGVYGSVLRHCAGAVYVPMLGKGRSLNVHVAAAIVAYRAAY